MTTVWGLLFCNNVVAGQRYTLEAQKHDVASNTSTAIYFDNQEQRIVKKTFKWSHEFERRRRAANRERFNFPAVSSNLSNVSPKTLDAHNVKVSYEHHSLYHPGDRNRTSNAIKNILGSKVSANSFVRRMEAKVDKSDNQYILVQKGSSGKGSRAKDIAVYFNKERGEFVTKTIKRKRSNSPAFDFPPSIARPAILNPSTKDSFYKLEESDSYWAKTPNQFAKALSRIRGDFNSANVAFDKGKFQRSFEQKKKIRSGDVLIKEQYKGYKLYRVYYNYDRNEMMVQEMDLDRKDRSKVKKLSETVYDLTTDYGYQGARNALVSSKVIGEGELDSFRGAQVTACRDVLESHILPDLTDFENITDALWDRHLHQAVASDAIKGPNRSMFLELNLLDKPRRVKVFLDAKGQVARVEWVGMTPEEAEKEGLKLDFKTDEDGQRNYLISTNYPDKESFEPIMGINADNIRVEKGILKGNLAVFVKGKKSGEFEYNEFEKSVFPFELDEQRRGIAKLEKRQRLDGSAKNYYDIDAPYEDGSGGIKNGFFKLFFSKDGRREFVRDTIYENATETLSGPDYNHLITNREVWTISDRISHQLGKKTGNYTSSVTDITAKGAELAYAAFGDEILLRVIKEMLPDESDAAINSVVLNVTEAFKECLARAGNSRNKKVADQCMEIFKTEAPIYVGKEVLLLKLRQNQLGDFEQEANKVYMACIRENYRPAASQPDSTNKIKGCLYQAFMETIDKAMGPTLDKEVDKIVKDKGYNFKLSASEKDGLLNGVKSCFKSKKLQSEGLFGTKYNFQKLEKMEPADFEQNLMGCVTEIKVGTGRIVVHKILGIELDKQDLTSDVKAIAQEKALTQGYEACVKKQDEIVNEFVSKMKPTAKSDPRPAKPIKPVAKTEKMVKVPTIEPGECANLVMNRTLSIVVPEMVKKAIGADFYKLLSKDPETMPQFLICFDREEKRLLDELPYILKTEAGLDVKTKEKNAKARAQRADKAHAGCLKEALTWASFHAVGQIVEDTLKEDPELSKLIKLTDKDKAVMGKKIQACFARELVAYETVTSMTDALDPLKEKCGVELLLDSEVQQIIFKPVIEGSLKDANIKDKDIEGLRSSILKGMNEEMKSAKTIEEVIAAAKSYKGKAAIQVIDFSIKDKISDLVEIENPDLKLSEVSRLNKIAQERLLSSSGLNFKERILKAASDSDPKVLDALLDEFKVEATKTIGPEVVELTGDKLLKDGLLSSEDQVKEMRKNAEAKLKECLDKKPAAVKVDAHIDECVVKLKSSTTEWVINTSLMKNLTDEENSRIFSKEDQQRIIGSILDDAAKKEIDRISRIKNKEEAEQALQKFTISVKSRAAGEIVKGVIPYTLNQVLTNSSRASDQMVQRTEDFKEKLKKELIGDFDICIEKYKKGSEAALAGNWSNEKYNPDEEFNACANRLRLSSMEKIMPFKFKEVLRLLNKNERENDSVIKTNQIYLNKCAEKVNIYSDPKEYKYKMDSCSVMTVFAFTKSAIQYTRDLGDGLFIQNPKTIEEWDACVSRMRGDVVEKLSPFSSDKSLEKIEDDFNFISEAFRKNANIKSEDYEPVTMEWVIDKIKRCALESLAPNLIQEYKMKVISDPKLKLSAREQAVTSSFLDSLSNILSLKYDGNPVNFQVDKFVKELNTELDNLPKSDQENKPDYLTVIEEFQPLIYDYVKDLVGYDQRGFLDGIKDFERRVKRAVELNKGKLSIPELKDILVDSKLGEILLKSLVSKIIKDKAGEALKKQGVSPGGVVSQLSSKEMLDRIFKGKKGQETITHVKRKLKGLGLAEIFQLLNTEKASNKKKLDVLMKDINGKVIDTLAEDTMNGGFVETLFGPIVQKSLTEKRDGIETGFSAIFKVPVAGLMGYNRHEFHWGTRWDNRSYSLRNTPSGKKAVQNFSSYILKPLMKDGMSDSELEKKIEKHIEPQIKEALGENGVGLWE